jgi:DHA1 family bicyclomycin/chloramphenicol resistance-like MFS transporter
MLTGLCLYVLASAGCALATSVEMLTALRFVQAVGACAGMVISLAVIRDSFPPQDGARMLSRMMLVLGVAPILAPLLGGQLLAWFGWRSVFWFLTLYGSAGLIGVALFLPETRPAHTRGPTGIASWLSGFAGILVQRRFIGFALTRGFAAAGMFAYIAGSPFVFIVLFGVPPEHFGWLFGSNAAGLIAASQINVRLLRRSSPERVAGRAVLVSATAGLCLVGAALLPLSLGSIAFAALLVPLFFCIATNGLINPNATALGMAPFGDRAGTASALIGSISFGIAGLTSAVVSAFNANSALPMAAIIAGVELLAVFCFYVIALRAPALHARHAAH